MSNLTRIILPLALMVAACNDAPSSVQSTTRVSAEPHASVGGASAAQGIQEIVTALNAAWAAKSASAYVAPFTDESEVIGPTGLILSGKAAHQARLAVLLGGPFASSTQVLSIRRIQFLTGTLVVMDVDAVLTGFVALPPGLLATEPGVSRTRVRWVLAKNGSTWMIEAQQSTPIPPAP